MRCTEYVRTLEPETLTELERGVLEALRGLYRISENNGSCFDVLVRSAVELEESGRWPTSMK